MKVLFLNPDKLLNRWFFLFFISTSVGFVFYTIYHIITNNAQIVIPLMITAQLCFNFTIISLMMTVFSLEKYTKVAMSFKYFGTMIILFILMSLGYFIPGLTPELDMDDYNLGIVDTITNPILQIFVNFFRIALSLYVVYKYAKIKRKTGEETRSRIEKFFIGIILAIIGLFFNLIGGLLGELLIEIIALLLVNIGAYIIFRGFK
jgi:hypothetical protein